MDNVVNAARVIYRGSTVAPVRPEWSHAEYRLTPGGCHGHHVAGLQ